MGDLLQELKERAIKGRDIRQEEAAGLCEIGAQRPFALMAVASEIREFFKGKRVNICGIVNAKSGKCPENCRFCIQSVHYETASPVYDLLPKADIVAAARRAKAAGAHMFGIVTSGTCIDSEAEWKVIYEAVREIGALGIRPCASLGMIDENRAAALKKAGLYRYHHNLETARSHFDNICTTHDYQEDIDTILAAKKAGLTTCCGGIIGLGESMEQRIEFAFTLKGLDVNSVPVNILKAFPGTPLFGTPSVRPLESLVTIAIFRFVLPDKDIKLCGGKEANLRQLLPLGIVAGCNSLMTGEYLTYSGREPGLDMEMIKDLGLEPSVGED